MFIKRYKMKFEDLYYRLPKLITDACSKSEQDPIYHPEVC